MRKRYLLPKRLPMKREEMLSWVEEFDVSDEANHILGGFVLFIVTLRAVSHGQSWAFCVRLGSFSIFSLVGAC